MSDLQHRVRFRLDHRWAPARMSDYLDAELRPAGRRRMERHVGECAECRRVLAGLRAMLDLLRGAPAPASAPSSAPSAEAVRIAASVRARLRP